MDWFYLSFFVQCDVQLCLLSLYTLFVYLFSLINPNNADMTMNVLKIMMSIFLILSTLLIIWMMIMKTIGNLLLSCKG